MHLTGVVEVHPEVLVVEDSLNAVVRGVIGLISTAGGRLDKEILLNFSRSSADKDPGVKALASVFIIRLVVGLVIIDSDGLGFLISKFRLFGFLGFFIELGSTNRLLNNLEGLVFLLNFLAFGSLVLVFVNLRIFITHLVVVAKFKGTDHQAFVLCGDLLGGSSVTDISIVSSTNKDRAEGDGEIKGVSFLPV